MAEGCPAKCAKFLLIAFNVLFWLCGAALLAVGIWILADPNLLKYVGLIHTSGDDEWFHYAAYVLIAVGAFIFITGFAGCCGAIRESPCLLGVYIFLLVVVILVQIAAAVLAFVFKNQVESELDNRFGKVLMTSNFTTGKEDGALLYSGFGTAMNLFQQEFKCCGLNTSDDFQVVQDIGVFVKGVPYSCCPMEKADTRGDPQEGDNINGTTCSKTQSDFFVKGCKASFETWLDEKSLILIGLGIGIACLEIFGIIFAVCVCRNPSSDKYE